MNNIATDMSRLCGEIAALRDSRAELQRNLAEAIEGLHEEVSRLLTGIGETRAEMAKQTKTELGEFVLQLKGQVADLLGGFRDDLAGAHRAWYGASSAPRSAPMDGEPATKARKKKR